MSDNFKVPITRILEINPHPNADRLALATVYGFQVVVQKDRYKVGDQILYIPIDSIIPEWLESRLFEPTSKVKLNNSRVRQIKLRGLASQGMIVDISDVLDRIIPLQHIDEVDVSQILGIIKYEPPAPQVNTPGVKRLRNRKHEHSLFHKYNGLSHAKWYPNFFRGGDEVVIQEKLHGTNARLSILPYEANTLKKKLLKFFRLAPKEERVYGSNNVDITAATEYKGFYGEDVYGNCFHKMNAFDKVRLGEIVYGEIIGPSIQKNYTYGLTEHKFLVFDVKVLQNNGRFRWMNPDEVEVYCKDRGFQYVPLLYKGPYSHSLAYSLTKGPSVFDPSTKIREGIVIKASTGYDVDGNKNALKWISEDYLSDTSNSDNH